jgi:hypothetical protein
MRRRERWSDRPSSTVRRRRGELLVRRDGRLPRVGADAQRGGAEVRSSQKEGGGDQTGSGLVVLVQGLAGGDEEVIVFSRTTRRSSMNGRRAGGRGGGADAWVVRDR